MLKNAQKTLLALAILASTGSMVQANDYYVATTGNDSNPGTLAQPWASINRGVDVYLPGDTVYIRAGIYSPSSGIYFYRSGSAAAPITFRSYNGEAVVLDGSKMPSMTTLVWIGCNYFVMQDLEVKNATGNGIAVDGGSYVTLTNCTVHDSQYSGITIGKNDMTTTHNVTVQNCTVRNNCHMNDAHTLNGGWPGALVAGGANTVTFQNNTVYNNNGEGMIFYLVNNCRSTGNISHDNYGPNMYIDNATNCVVERNMLYCSGNTTYFRNGTPAAGIQFANEPYSYQNVSHDITIINNILVNNNCAFYYGSYGVGGGLKNFVFANNSIYLSHNEALHVDADTHSNATFCNNVCTQSSTGTQAVLPASLTGLSFSHNLWNGKAAGAAASSTDVNADPMFVNPGSTSASDYKVQAGSPVKGAGAALTTVANDFFGASRNQPLDLGACVAPATVTPPPPPANNPPVLSAAPVATPNPALVGQNVTFSATATDADSDPLTFTWTFTDGSTQIGASVVRAFATAGTASVKVTVTDGKGGSVSQTISVTINPLPTPPANTAPKLSAAPTATPNPALVGQNVTFSATATDADSDPLTFTWTFADGSTLSGATVARAFATAGMASVNVTVTDGKGGSDSQTISVTINAQPVTPPNSAPVISSAPTYSPNPAVAGQNVTFVAAASDANNDALTFTWDLGDGTTQVGASISKMYPAQGVFAVKVTVTDGKGGSVSQTISVTVNAPAPVAAPLNVSSVGMTFNLLKVNADTISVTGTVPLPAGFPLNGTNAIVTIGGYQHVATLNAKGLSTDRTFKLVAKKTRTVSAVNNVAFVMTVKKAALFNQLQSLGLSNANGLHDKTITVSLAIGELNFSNQATAAYSVVGGL